MCSNDNFYGLLIIGCHHGELRKEIPFTVNTEIKGWVSPKCLVERKKIALSSGDNPSGDFSLCSFPLMGY